MQSSEGFTKDKSTEAETAREEYVKDHVELNQVEENLDKYQNQKGTSTKSATVGIHTDYDTSKEVEDTIENSEHGDCFDDFISPGGEHFTFGSFQNVEIKNLWKVETRMNSLIVINKYGANMFKSKSDPIVAVEAKQDILSGQHSPIEPILENSQAQDCLQEDQLAEADDDSLGRVSIPNPYNSTQETVERPSQEPLSQESHTLGETVPSQKQSDRLQQQGNFNKTIAEKAEAILAMKNLEGNSLSSKNSFAILENNDIIIKAGKLGIDSQNLTYEKIEILKDLERARAGLSTRTDPNTISMNKAF